MVVTLNQHELYRDAEIPRLARWFGESDIGPVYFERPDRPIPVAAHERDVWLARAERIVERHAARLRWVGFEAIAIAVVLMAAMTIAAGLVGGAVPVLRTIPPPFAMASALAWPLIHDQLYRRELRALRREIADRVGMRSPLDPAWVPLGKRYNLFGIASLLVAYAVVAWGVASAIHGGGVPDAAPLIVAMPLAWILYFAARRVDRVQRAARASKDLSTR